ncbi:MAG: zinc ribbon domain-containing protein [Acidobacteriota bacterium]
MATSTGKTIGLIVLIFVILFLLLHVVSVISPVFILSNSFPHMGGIGNFGNFITTFVGPFMNSFMFQLMPLGLLVLWIAVTLWVYSDAEQRNMNGVLWGLLVFVGNIIGLLIYLIVRNEGTSYSVSSPSVSVPESNPCPSCRAEVQAGFAFCPQCGSKMKGECQKCKKPVSNEWQLCPFCGERLVKPTAEGDQ